MARLRSAAALGAVLALGLAACAADPGSTGEPAAMTGEPAPTRQDTPPERTVDTAGTAAPEALLVRGIFDPEGDELLRLDPAAVVPGPARRPAAGTRGIFLLEVSFADGSVSRVPFDALIAADSAAGTTEHGFFEVSAPVDGEIVGARVVRADGSVVAEVTLDGG